MSTVDIKLDGLVDELVGVLDDDIKHIKLTLERLDALRAAVVRRDEGGLKSLLDEIKAGEGSYGLVEKKRRAIRKEMADIFACGINEMNLSKLAGELAGEKRGLVVRTQEELRQLADKLRKEHMATSMLLKECSRFNKELLRGILGNGSETETYNNRGGISWELQQGMVSLRG